MAKPAHLGLTVPFEDELQCDNTDRRHLFLLSDVLGQLALRIGILTCTSFSSQRQARVGARKRTRMRRTTSKYGSAHPWKFRVDFLISLVYMFRPDHGSPLPGGRTKT